MSSTDPMLVPELLVTDVQRSIEFWCGLCGFAIAYQREQEGFAYVTHGSAHVMLEQVGVGRNWITGPLDPPLGRGINFQVSVASLAPILEALNRAGHAPLHGAGAQVVSRRRCRGGGSRTVPRRGP